jgi:UDP-N-acetylmuramate dehydrogenase
LKAIYFEFPRRCIMNYYKDFSSKLLNIVEKEYIKIDEPMKNHTSFKAGGPADILIIPRTYDEVAKIIMLCKENNVPYYTIGNGSNLLVKDGGIRGVVIKLTRLNNVEVKGERITVQSGAWLISVSMQALKEGLKGLEFACGIPGSVGGAVTMNAGAYDGDMSKVIESALIIDDKGNIRTLTYEELELGYRMSAILKYGYTVIEVTLKLVHGEYDKIKHRMDELTFRRTDKQPLEYPSAGSTFKRPEGHFTGALIEECGLKGISIGGAAVSEKHAGFIINKNNATASDILNLIEHVENTVREKFGVQLHTEVRILGED